MHKYAFPQRMAIFCLLILLSAISGLGSTIIPKHLSDPLDGIFALNNLSNQRSYRTFSMFVDANGDYRSAASGNWNSLATWQRFNGTAWVAAPAVPNNNNAAVITIRSPHIVTITADVEYDQVVVESGSQLTVNPNVTHVLNNGPIVGHDLIINGTLLNRGGTWATSGATWSVGAGGTYIHETASGISQPLDNATLDTGSTFVYRRNTTNPEISLSNRTYYNLAFESLAGVYTTAFGSGGSPLTVAGSLRIGPNVNWSKGSFTGALNFNGDVTVEGTLTSNSNITMAAGKTMTLSGSGSAVMTAGTLTINGTLKTGTSNVSGAGNFALSGTGKIEIGSPDGITSTLGAGSIRNTGSRHFDTGASYIYNGAAAQVTGNALPATVGTLKIDNASGVTLSGATSVSNVLELANGKLITTSSNWLSTGGLATSIVGGSNSSYVSGPLRRTFGMTAPNPIVFPVGKSGYNPFELVNPTVETATATVEAEVFDQNSNGTSGTGLISINSNRYWSASITAGVSNFTNTRIRLTDSSINANSVIGRSATVSGVYNSIGGTVAGSTILSDPISTFSSFVIGTLAPTQQQLSVNKTGPGKVTGSGIDCGSDCSEAYDPGSSITLTAVPDAGASFTGWGGACSGNTLTCQVTVNAATAVTATFAPLAIPTITVSDVSATEGQSGTKNLNFSVTLSSPASVGGVTFDIATADNGSALAGTDYQSRSLAGQTIAAGESGPISFSVVVNGDTSAEPNETFAVNLSAISGATAGDLQGVGTIQNDDVPPIISSVAVSRTQGSGSNSAVANVTDAYYTANSVSVTVEGAASLTRNGVTVSNLSVDNAGVVTADVSAAVGSSDASFTLLATNGSSLTGVSTLHVTVIPAACSTTTSWEQQQKITASDATSGDNFGAVAVSGNTAVVGAVAEQNGRGAVYVYVRSGSTWIEQAKLTANDGSDGDNLGISVAISADTVIAGAHSDGGTGSAYVFTRSGTVWSQQQKLLASDGVNLDQFGRSVGIAGDTVVVGASVGDGPVANSGAAYVFTRSGSAWTQQQKLTGSDSGAGDRFAQSVAISGDTIAIGASLFDSPFTNSGAAYIFTRSGTDWSLQQKLTASDASASDEFGHSVAISGDSVVVGSVLDKDPGLLNIGSAYVFVRSGMTWSQQQRLTLSSPTPGDEFGFSVGISGDTLAVGARENEGPRSGSAYIFTRSGTSWTQKQELAASDASADDLYGISVALHGSTAVVGAIGDDGGAGSAYAFALNCAAPAGPEIAIAQGASNINSGDVYDFGDQKLNMTSELKHFSITNTGSAPLTITEFTQSGTNSVDFQRNGITNATIQPSETASFYVSFYPSGLGVRTAKLEIANGDSDENPFVINLKGTGTPPISSGTYTWNNTLSGDWSLPANWTPARLTPSSGDILIIDGTVTPAPTISNVGGLSGGVGSGETIAKLLITNGADPNLSALTSAKTLSISGEDGTDLDIGAGSTVRLTGTVPLSINIGASATASVVGVGVNAASLILEDGSHRLIGNTVGAITIGAGGFVTTVATYPGSSHPFGSGNGDGAAGSVVFQSGSVYSHNGGNSPFGAVGAAAVSVFQDGSLAQWLTNSGFQGSGRTYADLTVGSSTAAVTLSPEGSGNFSFGNLKVVSTNTSNSLLSFIGTGSSSITIRGNIRSEGAGSGSIPDVILSSGPTGQTVVNKTGGGTINFDTVGNGRGIQFESDVTVSGGTTLTLSRIVLMGVGSNRTLQVNAGADVTGGTSGYVAGSLKQIFQVSGGLHSETYPVGTVNGYSPVSTSYSVSQNGTYEHTVKANQASLPGISGSEVLGRYWNLSAVNGPGTAVADVTFNYMQADVVGTEANYKSIRSVNGVFSSLDPAVLDTNGNFATVNAVTPSGDWGLANPSAISAGSIQLAQAEYSVNENGTNVTLNVIRTGGSDGVVSVQFATANGSASSPGDYAGSSGTLNWAAGDTSVKQITITINNDGATEGTENFTLGLSAPTGMATLGAPNSALITILDDEMPDATLTVNKSGNGTGTVTSNPAGINCGALCEEEFAHSSVVTLIAAPNTGSKFTGWTGCSPVTPNSCQVTLNGAKNVTAQFSLITVSGNVRLRNTLDRPVPLDDVPVAAVTLTAAGTPAVSGSSGADGNYSLSGFGGGTYTVTPSKADQTSQNPNGISIFDALTVASYVVGLEPGLTLHQIAAADVSGVAGVSSYDATLIARWVVDLPDPVNRTGKWSFSPSSVNHGVITDNIVQNYDALLFGDVTGDHGALPASALTVGDEATPVRISLGNVFAEAGSSIVVPLKMENLGPINVKAYQFDIQYDPAVLSPEAMAADLTGTIGEGMNIFYNVPTPGLLKVAVYDIYGVMGDGVYANLRFAATGAPGSASPMMVKGFRLNDGTPPTSVTDGNVFIGTGEGVSVNGRLITNSGSGVRGTQVTITAANGARFTVNSSSLGYFEFTGLTPGEAYTITVQSRRYRFQPVNINPAQAVTSIEMIALE